MPLLRILGAHGRHILSSHHLVGNFNLLLQCCVLAYIDEAFYAGDKAHESILKGLITELTLTVEGKFINAAEARNYLHIIVASNANWVVPAGLRERRFFILDVSPEHANDRVYFKKIRDQMEREGGDAAMLYDLMRVDLSKFDPADIPDTEGLRNQKQISLPLEFKWLEDTLSRGHVIDAMPGLDDKAIRKWFPHVTTNALYNSYLEFMKKQHKPYASPMALPGPFGFGAFMKRLGFDHGQITGALDGWIKGDGLSYNVIKEKLNPEAHPTYTLGSLDEARAQYAKAIGQALSETTSEAEPVVGSYCPWPQYAYRGHDKPRWDMSRPRFRVIMGGVVKFSPEPEFKYDPEDDWEGCWEVGADGERRWAPSAKHAQG